MTGSSANIIYILKVRDEEGEKGRHTQGEVVEVAEREREIKREMD